MASHSSPLTHSSFLHGHTLSLYKYTGPTSCGICDICNEPLPDQFYRCQLCDFDVHLYCTEFPRHLQHSLHSHHLVFNPSAERPCAVCDRACTCWRYSCHGCSFDIHLGCLLNGPEPQLRGVEIGVAPAGHKSVRRKIKQIAEGLAVGVGSSIIYAATFGSG